MWKQEAVPVALWKWIWCWQDSLVTGSWKKKNLKPLKHIITVCLRHRSQVRVYSKSTISDLLGPSLGDMGNSHTEDSCPQLPSIQKSASCKSQHVWRNFWNLQSPPLLVLYLACLGLSTHSLAFSHKDLVQGNFLGRCTLIIGWWHFIEFGWANRKMSWGCSQTLQWTHSDTEQKNYFCSYNSLLLNVMHLSYF